MTKSLTFTKSNFILLQNEKELLQNSLKIITEENQKLKNEVKDMKITVKENKKLLNDYLINIANKDKLYEKLNSIINELQEKIKYLEDNQKQNENNTIKNTGIKEINFININQNNNYSLAPQNNYVNEGINENNKNENEIRVKQNKINEEIINIKKQLDIIIEQNSLKNKLNQNLKTDINNDSNNESNNNNVNNDKLKNSFNNSFNNSYISEEISSLSNSFDENLKKEKSDSIFNLKEKYNIENLSNFFNKFDEKNDKIFLIDGKSNIWEIIKREDLSMDEIKKYIEK